MRRNTVSPAHREAAQVLKAILWDVDGTLAETERDGHLVALNTALDDLGLPWQWSEQRYGELLHIAGGLERLLHELQLQAWAPRDEGERLALASRIHRRKNERYVQLVERGAVTLRPGVQALLDDCAEAGLLMAVVTTTSRGNVGALLRANLGDDWSARFDTVVAAEDAPRKKPDPQAYALALQRLELEPHETVAIEDSPPGLGSAAALGIPVVITRSRFFDGAAFDGALAVGPSLGTVDGWVPALHAASRGRIGLEQLRAWHATHEATGAR
jgi:HAD superfamily hydrolase (TIGR01509 family)